MSISTIHQAKINLSRLIKQAECGEEVLIARGKMPVVKIVPIRRPKRRGLGIFKGVFTVGPEFFEPLPEDELRLWNCEATSENPGAPSFRVLCERVGDHNSPQRLQKPLVSRL